MHLSKMENDWVILPVCVWQDIESKIPNLTASIAAAEDEIEAINGVMTRSKRTKLKKLEDQLYYDEKMLEWYRKQRQERIDQTKIIIDQLLDFGFVCPTIQFEPFEYSCEEFCKLLLECQPIADEAHDLRMRGFRCTLFY